MKTLVPFSLAYLAMVVTPPALAQLGADECHQADDVTAWIGSPIPFDTNLATDTGMPATTSSEQQTQSPCLMVSNDVWLRFDATVGHHYRFDTCGTADLDTQINIWGGACAALEEYGCSTGTPVCPNGTGWFETTVSASTCFVQLGYDPSTADMWGAGTILITDRGPDPCFGALDDSFEPNDLCQEAFRLDAGLYSDLYVAQLDSDHYEVEVPAGMRLRTTTSYSSPSSNLTLRLSDGCSSTLAFTIGSSSQAELYWTNRTGTTVFATLRVNVSHGGFPCSHYDLELVVDADPCPAFVDDALEDNDSCASARSIGPGIYNDLFVDIDDPDHYSILVPAGDRLTVEDLVSVDDGVRLELRPLDCSSILASGSSYNAPMTWGNSGTSAARVVLEVSPQVPLFDRVCASYGLRIALEPDICIADLDDGLEPNDTCSTAIPLGPGVYPGLFVSRTDRDHYEIEVDPGQTLVAEIDFVTIDGDLELFLFDGLGECVASNLASTLTYGISFSDGELLTWTNATTQTQSYLLEVSMFQAPGQVCNTYDLRISGARGPVLGSRYCTAAPNSSGQPAYIGALGSSLVAAGDLTLTASNLPTFATTGIFFVGTNQVQVPFGDGFRCVGGAVRRSQPPLTSNESPSLLNPVNFNSSYAQDITAGATLNFQFWYRDPLAIASGFNLTDALQILFQ